MLLRKEGGREGKKVVWDILIIDLDSVMSLQIILPWVYDKVVPLIFIYSPNSNSTTKCAWILSVAREGGME